MTEEELDLLASSFLDGEATPEEVALIEREPTLLARVEELRVAQAAVRAPVPQPSMQRKQDQLTAALALFESSDRRTTVRAMDPVVIEAAEPADGEAADNPGPVIDLGSRRERRERETAVAAGRMRWLSAVAGVLVFTAGAVFLLGQVSGDGDGDEFAGDVVSDATEAGEEAEAELAPAAGADEAADADIAASTAAEENLDGAIDSEAMEADAEEDFALSDGEAVEEEAADDTADEGEDAAAESGPIIRDFAEEGFFGDEPVASFTSIPTSDELLAELDLPWRSPESAACAAEAQLPEGAEVIAYLPIEIPSTDGSDDTGTRVVEALYLTVGNQSQVILVDPENCQAT